MQRHGEIGIPGMLGLLFILCLGAACGGPSTPGGGTAEPGAGPAASPAYGAITEWADGYVARGDLAGIVVLIARDGEIVYAYAGGHLDMGGQRPVASDSMFRVFSMTKPVIAAGIMRLVDQGKVSLDDPVSDYIPEVADLQVLAPGADSLDDTVPLNRPITVLDLMTHTAGFANTRQGMVAERAEALLVMEATIDLETATGRLLQLPLAHQPGERWLYGSGFEPLARVIEIASGQSLRDFFRVEFFDPLGMDDTHFILPEAKADRLSGLFAKRGGRLVNLSRLRRTPFLSDPGTRLASGNGGLVSTAPDFLRFAEMLRQGGRLDGVRILSEASVDLMLANQIAPDLPIGPPLDFRDGYGFGFGGAVLVDAEAGAPATLGEYYWEGFANTLFWIEPETGVSVIALAQIIPYGTYPLAEELKPLVREAVEIPQDPK
jgi:CubicO group peptidase (beta-lactamase class C family)